MNNPQFNPFVTNIQQQLAQAYQNMQGQNNNQTNGCYMYIVQDEMVVHQWGLGPGQSAFFFNPTSGLLYLKANNQNNIPEPLRRFKVTEITNQNNQIPQVAQNAPVQATIEQTADTVTREEFKSLMETINEMQKSLKELTE
jgi:hypothetical protein